MSCDCDCDCATEVFHFVQVAGNGQALEETAERLNDLGLDESDNVIVTDTQIEPMTKEMVIELFEAMADTLGAEIEYDE
jgi:hypothetical protein